MVGTKLAHYEITFHLGSGGMGDVYQATDSKLAIAKQVCEALEAAHESIFAFGAVLYEMLTARRAM